MNSGKDTTIASMQGRGLEHGRQVVQHLFDFRDDPDKSVVLQELTLFLEAVALFAHKYKVFLKGGCIEVKLIHGLLTVKASMPL
jgi:hypothetical protein